MFDKFDDKSIERIDRTWLHIFPVVYLRRVFHNRHQMSRSKLKAKTR